MTSFAPADHPHRRFNLLTGEWVLVSPHRNRRPWQGQVERRPPEWRPEHDPGCYLCAGNERAAGARNPDYADTFVFDNDFAALTPDVPPGEMIVSGLLRAESEPGICRVVCFSPRHDLSLAQMETPAIRRVVDVWTEEYRSLGSRENINYVQIFENKGEVMGCSNPHPHGQIWAQRSIPVEPAKETERMLRHYREYGRSLLEDYLRVEQEQEKRIVYENDGFVVLVPFWAVWPFEAMIVSRRRRASLLELTEGERDDLADALKRLTSGYDRVFDVSFPYSAGIHQAPTDGKEHPEWHLHMHFYPPLLRSATVRKFMVGYEMLGNPQRDLTPEASAERLRERIAAGEPAAGAAA